MCANLDIAVESFASSAIITCGFTSLNPRKPYCCIRMAESNNDFGSGSKIEPYQFEPLHATGYGDSEDGSTGQNPQIGFTKCLNNRLV